MLRVVGKSIINEMETSYLDYALSVIISRALPDVRDGLKPVNRRILFAMYKLGIKAGSKYKKSAFIVGEVMGKYHPHGDASIYMAMVRMAQYFSLRYPLVDGQGNFGSIDGDSPAAMRYTEARMEKISEYILSDIEKETVDWGPNYDGSFSEPKVLPSRLPNLLLNGVSGIAVGMATNIPPHNLGELIEALIHLVDNKEASIDDLCQFIKWPDFPTRGTIYDIQTIKTAYETGRGSVVVRGEAEITENSKGKKKIIITEIPYQVNKANLIIKIADLVKDRKIEGINDIRDESAKEEIRIVIDLKRDAFPQKILNQLFKLTPLQSSFPFNMVALAKGIQPKLMNLKTILKSFLDHRFEVITRRTQYELKVAKARMHILEGFRIALDNIDEVIKIIKGSKSRIEAKGSLMERFDFSEKQTDAILEMKLHTLTNLETQKILDELKEKLELIGYLETLLSEDIKIYDIIKEELLEIKEKFADKRLTRVVQHKVDDFRAEDLIPNEEEVIILTKGNYIKRIPVSNFKSQKRGGVGIKGAKLKEEDEIKSIIYANSHDEILVLSSKGIVFKIKAFDVPQTSRIAKGTSIYNIIELASTSDVATLVNVPSENKEKWFLVFATKKGLVKKTNFLAYQNIRKNGLLAVKLKEGDDLAWVKVSFDNDYCLLITKQGKSIVFETNQVRAMGRNSSGVRWIRLKGEDQVIEMDLLAKEVLDGGQKVDLLTVSKFGFSKRTLLKNFRIQGRGGTGIKAMNINSKTGEIVKAKVVCNLEQDLLLMASSGNVIRLALKSMNRTGRVTQGVKLIKLKKGEYVASVTFLNLEVINKNDKDIEKKNNSLSNEK